MPISLLDAVDFTKVPSLQFVVPVVAADPAGYEAGLIYNSTSKEVKYHNGTAWVALGPAGAGGPPTGTAGGDLTGSYPNPQIAAGVIIDADVAAANKDGAAATPSMRTLGTGSNQAAAGNDSRFLAASPPNGNAGGDLSGTYPNPQIAAGVIVDADVAAANKDGAVATPSLRTLGLGAQQALAGNTPLNGITAPTADVSLNSKKITSLLDPTAAQDAATKNYVDSIAQGLDPKASVKAATISNIATLAGGAPSTLDGTALAANDRVLVKDQTAMAQNGIYTVTTLGTGANGTWTRSTDMDAWTEVPGAYTWVEQGATQADTGWLCTADQGGTLGTTAMTWTQFSGSAVLSAGAGMTKTGNTLDVVSANAAHMVVNADNIAIVSAPKWTTPVSFSLTGDVTGTASSVDGSAAVSIATTVVNAGKRFAQDVPAGTALVITHNLNTRDLQVSVQRTTTPWDKIQCGVEMTSVNTVTLRFAVAVAANAYRVVIVG